jgi:YfiH family protein
LDWAVNSDNVHAYSTLISGGFSTGSYAEFNLATHVGDELTAVTANREKLKVELNLPTEPVWLEQVHGEVVIDADEYRYSTPAVSSSTQSAPQADASVSRAKGTVCAVLTADCLPVFFCNMAGTEVAVAHAGWRGLHAGIIRATIKKMHSSAEELLVSLGPAIGSQAFEVGDDVKQAFVEKNSRYLSAFNPVDEAMNNKHYLCDIYQLARIELALLGVNPERITGGQYCTFSEVNRFYSFRRQKQTGRMANLIWLT